MLLSTTLRWFLDGIGRREEYEFYLRKFQTAPGACFAALLPDAAAMEQSEEAIAFDLHFLLRLELVPMMLFCGSDAADLHAAWTRVMPGGLTLDASRETGWKELVESRLHEARERRTVPALLAPGVPAADLLKVLIPSSVRRLHILRARGPLHDIADRPVSLHLVRGRNDHTLAEAEADVVQLAASCLDTWPQVHVSVAAPIDLMAEMFTVRGKGTTIRRGSVIDRFETLAEVDASKLAALLVEAFGRPLSRPEILDGIRGIYLERAYRGAVLLEPHPAGRYLSKFAVGTQARGEGLAQELWNEVIADHPALFWRSRPGNPINGWYEQQADGRHRGAAWTVFWRGIEPEAIPSILRYCATRPPDFPAEPAAGRG